MLTCSACRERCLQAVLGSLESSPSIASASFVTTRRYGTKFNPPRRSSGIASELQRQTPFWSLNRSPLSTYATNTRTDVSRGRQALDREPNLDPGGFPISRKEHKLERAMRNVLQKHPVYGNDPLKLADYVRKALRGDDFETALAVTRAASKDLQCIVSWNHLIDWQLSKGKMNGALKTYNEMKKRRQIPDAYTYTIIFRGCAEHKDLSSALGKVITLYHSMLAEKSPVKPNAIHMNAVLKMCARAKDMDAMFGIISQMQTKGATAPDPWAYTTVFNALQRSTIVDIRSTLTPMQKRHNAQKAIFDGRHIWKDITKRWRKGDIWIDEHLVCAMGRLLLTGEYQDVDDVLSLIEQTMNISRQVPRLGTSERKAIDPSSQHQNEATVSQSTSGELSQASAALLEAPTVNSFEDAEISRSPHKSTSAYAKPGRNTLSLVLEALGRLKLKGPSTKYWDIFVKQIGVVPDIQNFHAYLRNLRIARASTETVELLEDIPRSEMKIATFRIAMSCCARDKNNPNVFANSTKIIDMMTSAINMPDIQVLTRYLEVAISASVGADSKRSDTELAKHTQGKQIFAALNRLTPSIDIETTLLRKDPSEFDMTEREFSDFQKEVLALARQMVSAYDIIRDRGLADASNQSDINQQRNKLTDVIHKYKHAERASTKEIYLLPNHLLNYVYNHHLTRTMVRAQTSRKRWDEFRERLETEYEFEREDVKKAKKAKGESSSEVSEVDKLAEEERKAAEAASKGFNEAATSG